MRTNITKVNYKGRDDPLPTFSAQVAQRTWTPIQRALVLSIPWACFSSFYEADFLHPSPCLTRATDRKDERSITDTREATWTKAPSL